jgi:hypothetical protein
MEEALVFCVRNPAPAGVEVRVNFGVFAGRNATHAEIDDLARLVRHEVEAFAILAEERHEFGDSEAVVRQVVIEVAEDDGALCDQLVEIAERWAEECIHARADLGELGSEI